MACCLMTPSIMWTNIDFPFVRIYGIHLAAVGDQAIFCIRTLKSNFYYILQFTVGCNYLSLYEIPAEGWKMLAMH